MKHHYFNPNAKFVKEPEDFNKYTEREKLQYCLGGMLYMPATKEFAQAILGRKYSALTTMAMCFEDACEDDKVQAAEENVLKMLDTLAEIIQIGGLSQDTIPLIFFRVRSVQQFKNFSQQLKPEHFKLIAGFIFPKFTSENGYDYLSHLRFLNETYREPLYGMPILEDRNIAQKETRMEELTAIRTALDTYKDFILNVRVGCTDISSCFGVRRKVFHTIYDVITVRDCLADVLNVFHEYVVSGPVWEYFKTGINEEKDEDAMSGLLRELYLDRLNGFIGKTCIHPTQLPYVNQAFAVTEEEFEDANQILGMSSGVAKGSNKMNEAKPHRNWAKRILGRAAAYGVIEDR